jgi:hypothetical protein
VADQFNWPPEEAEIDAVEIGTEPIAPPDPAGTDAGKEDFTQERRTSRFSSGPDLAALDAIQQRLRAKAMRSEDQFDVAVGQPPTTHPGGLQSGALGALAPSVESEQHKQDANRVETPAARQWRVPAFLGAFTPGAIARRYAGTARSDWRRAAYRAAFVALAVIVVVESAFLAIGFQKGRTPPSADGQANVITTPAERPAAPPQETINWQAAVAANAAAVSAPAEAPKPSPIPATPAPVAPPGSLSLSLPFQVEVYEDDRFVGVNNGADIRLSAGSHRLTLVNESLRYRATQTVNISSGRTTTVTASLPTGMLQLNATPWAEVLLDGKSLGETPLGNVSVPIGPHTLVFRHPELGQQSRSVVVTAQSSTRVAVDLQKQ